MKRLTPTICLTLAVLLGSVELSWGADFNKGLAAAQNGDYATALREWTPLAEQGYASAQYNLGLMYHEGVGVPQDYKTAAKWYTRAAQQGYADAQSSLGGMYRNGQGVPQDYKTAAKWYTLAAQQGHANAQTNLGVMYVKGDGVPQNYVYAHMWWNISASSGHKKASANRDRIAKEMTPADISAAQNLASECVAKKYKGC
tara:strand:- start:28 stop:627 length:600 start_codon:yes stop_codon:yes gene_type:complete